MSLDPNEINGFIGHCRNTDYLIDLKGRIDSRLRELGVAPHQQARPMESVPAMQDGRVIKDPKAPKVPQAAPAPKQPVAQAAKPQEQQPKEVVVTPTPPLPAPEPAVPAGPAGTVEEGPKRRTIIAQSVYEISELLDEGKRIAFHVRNMAKGTHYHVDTPESGGWSCDCPAFTYRKPENTKPCKHIVGCASTFRIENPPVALPQQAPVAAEPSGQSAQLPEADPNQATMVEASQLGWSIDNPEASPESFRDVPVEEAEPAAM